MALKRTHLFGDVKDLVRSILGFAVGGCTNIGESQLKAARTPGTDDMQILLLVAFTNIVSDFCDPQDEIDSGGEDAVYKNS